MNLHTQIDLLHRNVEIKISHNTIMERNFSLLVEDTLVEKQLLKEKEVTPKEKEATPTIGKKCTNPSKKPDLGDKKTCSKFLKKGVE